MKEVWVFNGIGSRFVSGVFSDRLEAERWITKNRLSGILTLYPLNKGIYNGQMKKIFLYQNKKVKNLLNLYKSFLQPARNITIMKMGF